jgi:ABC-type glycerol-3-phosphate transport system permease component
VALCSELSGYQMANLERGFRRLTLAASILLMLPFLGATIPSFLAKDGPATLLGLGLTVLAFLLPWLLFIVGRWIARGFRD